MALNFAASFRKPEELDTVILNDTHVAGARIFAGGI